MNEKKWKKNCPKCNKVLYYANKSNLTYSLKNDCWCSKCRNEVTMKKAHLGVKRSLETREKLSKVLSGRTLSKEHKENIGKASPFRNLKAEERWKKIYEPRWKISYEERNEWYLEKYKRYRRKVNNLTEKQPLHLLENFDKRGKSGVDGAYQVDHIVSVKYGFDNNIPAEKIASFDNLQVIPWEENRDKWYD